MMRLSFPLPWARTWLLLDLHFLQFDLFSGRLILAVTNLFFLSWPNWRRSETSIPCFQDAPESFSHLDFGLHVVIDETSRTLINLQPIQISAEAYHNVVEIVIETLHDLHEHNRVPVDFDACEAAVERGCELIELALRDVHFAEEEVVLEFWEFVIRVDCFVAIPTWSWSTSTVSSENVSLIQFEPI